MAPGVDVMRAKVVREKEGVEFASIQQFRQIDPVIESVLVFGSIGWVSPLSWTVNRGLSVSWRPRTKNKQPEGGEYSIVRESALPMRT
jgi:hypothetical protein